MTMAAPNAAPSPSPSLSPSWASNLGSSFSKLDSSSMVVFSVVCVVVLVLIIAYIVWRIRRRDLKNTTLVDAPLLLYGSGVPLTISKSKIPPTVNGQEYSYSMWMYLVQYDLSASPMLVFGRGIKPGNKGGSPLVYLDSKTNLMYVSVATNTALLTTTIDQVSTSSDYVTAKINYVPLQRWVNITMVIQDYLMTLYMDGDIYTVSNITDAPDAGWTQTSQSGPVFGPTAGDITVGSGAPQAKGFLSQLQFFNYALTQNDVQTRYAAGPTSASAMAMFGVPAYGIRSPLYKLDGS